MYKIKQEIADIDRAALEVEWVGTLAVPFGSIPAGGQMKGFCRVSGVPRKIIRQRNYDCFEALIANGKGKWGSWPEGTVTELAFVVPFRHCLGRSKQPVFDCVGKVRAIHLYSAVLSV
jgi:hypothetical protein